MSHDVDKMLRHFLINLKTTGRDPPYNPDALTKGRERRARLEFGRHYGVPSPLIDFSRSPYVAAFFAFSGVRPYDARDDDQSAVYCLNVFQLADLWARHNLAAIPRIEASDLAKESARYTELHNKFMNAEPDFEKEYPANRLMFIQEPASWNRRMQRQLGSFLYDSMNYKEQGFDDLEHFLAKSTQTPRTDGSSEVTLTKIFAPHKMAREVLEHLDVMGISATHLYDDAEGAAIDVVNEYVYQKTTNLAWDLDI
jgi:hypothetical protein